MFFMQILCRFPHSGDCKALRKVTTLKVTILRMGDMAMRKIIIDIDADGGVAIATVCMLVYLVVLGITLSSETLASAIQVAADVY